MTTNKELASLVLTLFSAIARNPSILDMMKRRESVRKAGEDLLAAVQAVFTAEPKVEEVD